MIGLRGYMVKNSVKNRVTDKTTEDVMKVNKTYMLALKLETEMDTNGVNIPGNLDKTHLETLMETFAKEPDMYFEYYKCYCTDLFGAESSELTNQIAEHIKPKTEKENIIAVLVKCPEETRDYFLDIIDKPEEEYKKLTDEEKYDHDLAAETFLSYIMHVFQPPRISNALFADVTGEPKEGKKIEGERVRR